jgi:hypothetical protein
MSSHANPRSVTVQDVAVEIRIREIDIDVDAISPLAGNQR